MVSDTEDYPVGVDENEARSEWHRKNDNTTQCSAVNVMVGHKLALIRNALGWSQNKIAEKVGLSRASIANIEGGRQKVDLDTVENFCIALGVTPHHFMKGIWFIDGRMK